MERLNIFGTSPAVTKALMSVEQQIAKLGIEKVLANLVRIRASQVNGCAFCLDMHFAEARKAGEDDRRLATISAWREATFFSDRERAALAWTESVTLVATSHVPDDVWQRVRPHFTPEELMNLTLLITTINAWNRFAIAFRKQPA